MKVHVADKVFVTAGKYKGKTGNVLRVDDKNKRVVVEKVNIRTRHIKKSAGQPGQRIQYEGPFDISKVMVVCPHCNKPTRVGHVLLEGVNSRKQRICKKCNQTLDKASAEKKVTKKR
ncbi:50S ribosomal protein L24 [Candidatus Gracilibacteria bacterium]|nr:50S ribosomal protein L24 [Candidatus Gracilibacteria bacterium]